jgi:catechol 2,3-dioxygenase-like lactoylglutathione lyase family enzyme
MNRFATLSVLFLSLIPPGVATQLSPPNASGVSMGHLHYIVRDVPANRDFWVALGGKVLPGSATAQVVGFPDVLVFLSEGNASGNTDGSVVNHVAFRVRSLAGVEAAGFEVEYLEAFPGVASVFTPEGERIELFDETATNLTFTVDPGRSDPGAGRHNEPITSSIVAHHIHLYVPEGDVAEVKAWYARAFGATPGMRWRYDAVDLPGINLNFSGAPERLAPTEGRMLDHIGFEVEHLQAFCDRLEAAGMRFDQRYTLEDSGIATAILTDPWGTRIELTEGLTRFQ